MPHSCKCRYDSGHFIEEAARRDPALPGAELYEGVLEELIEREDSSGQLRGRPYELHPSILVDDGAVTLGERRGGEQVGCFGNTGVVLEQEDEAEVYRFERLDPSIRQPLPGQVAHQHQAAQLGCFRFFKQAIGV